MMKLLIYRNGEWYPIEVDIQKPQVLIPSDSWQLLDNLNYIFALLHASKISLLLWKLDVYLNNHAPYDHVYQVVNELEVYRQNICYFRISDKILTKAMQDVSRQKSLGSEILEKKNSGLKPFRQNTVDANTKVEKPRSGFIYLVQAVIPDNYFKIGRSKNPRERIQKLGVKLPFPLEILHIFPTDNMVQAEKELHSRFSEKRVKGEWFELAEQDVIEIKSIDKIIYL